MNWRSQVSTARAIASELAEYGAATTIAAGEDVVLEPEDDLLAVFDARIVDPDLRAATRTRFVSLHYADAVESGVKCLNEVIRARTGRTEDGDPLMTTVFSVNAPLLRINPLRSQSDISAQRGHMMLCQGVVAAWRNPRAHSLLDDDPLRAIMMLETVQDLIGTTKSAVRTRRRPQGKA